MTTSGAAPVGGVTCARCWPARGSSTSLSALARRRAQSRRVIALALAVTAAIFLAEVVGGILTNSLALLAGAGHMASDIGALALGLGAIWLASRPPSRRRTYGFHRAEGLAALLNSLALIAVAGYVFWEASRRSEERRGGKEGR